MAEAPVAPSAMRMPISQVRRLTTKDITPWRPIKESGNASAPQLPERAVRRRAVVSEQPSEGLKVVCLGCMMQAVLLALMLVSKSDPLARRLRGWG